MAEPTPTEGETTDFVRELSRDLSPVERIARLRTGALRVLALWVGVSLVVVAVKGITGNVFDPDRLRSGFGAILAGLSLVGVGGLVTALATSVPGRESTARAASGLVAFGLLLAIGLGAVLLRADPSASVAATFHSDVMCLTLAAIVAVLPSLGALLYVVRAAPARPVPTLWGVALGCVALAAFTVQLGCMDSAFRHLLVSHALAPAIGSAVFLAPLWLGFRRLRSA